MYYAAVSYRAASSARTAADVPAPPAEASDQLDRGAEAGEWLHAKDAKVFCRGQPFVGVLVEQGIEHGTGRPVRRTW